MAQVFDLRNKVVAASAPVEPPVRWIATAAAGCIDIGGWTAGCSWAAVATRAEGLRVLF